MAGNMRPSTRLYRCPTRTRTKAKKRLKKREKKDGPGPRRGSHGCWSHRPACTQLTARKGQGLEHGAFRTARGPRTPLPGSHSPQIECHAGVGDRGAESPPELWRDSWPAVSVGSPPTSGHPGRQAEEKAGCSIGDSSRSGLTVYKLFPIHTNNRDQLGNAGREPRVCTSPPTQHEGSTVMVPVY